VFAEALIVAQLFQAHAKTAHLCNQSDLRAATCNNAVTALIMNICINAACMIAMLLAEVFHTAALLGAAYNGAYACTC
jgi:hypothetical protein